MDHKTVEDYILGLPNVVREYPFGEGVAVYKVNKSTSDVLGQVTQIGKMFALITEGKEPLQISLKCDPLLAKTLRDKYESVMPGYHLNKKHWNTILLSGQLSWSEVQDLIHHSYNLVSGL